MSFLNLGVRGFGLGACGLGFRVRVSGSGFGVWGIEFCGLLGIPREL